MNIVCSGKLVSIRQISQEDTNNIVRWRNHPNVLKNFIDQQQITSESHQNWLKTKVFTGEVIQFIIQDNETKTDIGSVFIRDIDLNHRRGEFGIFIGEDDFRGQGRGAEAGQLICRYAFENIGLERIYLRVLSNNSGAIRSYQKIGFVEEGVFRNHVVVNGTKNDLVFMGLLKEEFTYEQ